MLMTTYSFDLILPLASKSPMKKEAYEIVAAILTGISSVASKRGDVISTFLEFLEF
jgi:hypothetical protein